jgi:hypothetical protein
MKVADLLKLCEQALVDDRRATPGPWTWWTSNSVRRLSSPTGDGDVLHGDRNLHDDVVDIVGKDFDKDFIATTRTREPVIAEALHGLLNALEPCFTMQQLSLDGFIEVLTINRRLRANLNEACNLAETALLRADGKILPSTNATLVAWRQEATK